MCCCYRESRKSKLQITIINRSLVCNITFLHSLHQHKYYKVFVLALFYCFGHIASTTSSYTVHVDRAVLMHGHCPGAPGAWGAPMIILHYIILANCPGSVGIVTLFTKLSRDGQCPGNLYFALLIPVSCPTDRPPCTVPFVLI